MAIHTLPNVHGGWDNKIEGYPNSISHHIFKEEAVKRARSYAAYNRIEHVIYNYDGSIEKRKLYSKLPFQKIS